MPLVRFEIASRVPYAEGRRFGAVGAYEQLDGTAHFAVDPSHPANARICDLKLAPRTAAGLVEFTSDFSLLQPLEAAKANGRCIVELPNRGRRRVVALMNGAPPDAAVGPQAHPGDGFLFARGYSVASIGWQWDVYPSPELLGLAAPSAIRGGDPIGGQTMVEMRPNTRETTRLLADRVHRPLPAAAGAELNARLLVRNWEDGEDTLIPRARWRFARETAAGVVEPSSEHVWLEGGFEPGRIYQLVYDTDRAPVAGLGLLAARDVAAFLRRPSSSTANVPGFKTLILYGISQTGRMQRHFLSLALNRCEDGSRAYDGLHVHIAGARRGAFNHRFAQPSNQTTPLWGHVFPFADVVTSDPLTGRTGGLLDRLAAADDLPKIISTDSAAEYWRGDAALAHIDVAARHDLPEHPLARRYLFAGAQHTPGYLGQTRTNPSTGTIARYPLNVIDYLPLHRAALVNLDRWISDNIEPPPSRHPRLSDASAVNREEVLAAFARLPGFTPPQPQRLPFIRTVDMGSDEETGVGRYPAQEGAFYPALVSGVDADGNEIAGIRLPDVSVPVGTHAGWNPRDPSTGSPEQIVPMNGLTLWFAPDEATRAARGDPRKSLAERYRDEADYAAKVRAAAVALAAERYLLEDDVEPVVAAAVARYRAALLQ
ncbi:MAG TPA: alpha/beta hydrolase domain-containing protein [Hyphomicrobiaceae bacterium]|nr:alpha/beta hydrolase domain-containing protein [Hyphomicrobiaceae bacterium]